MKIYSKRLKNNPHTNCILIFRFYIVFFLFPGLLLTSMNNCRSTQSSFESSDDWINTQGIVFNQQTIQTILQEMEPLVFTHPTQPSPALKNYFRYYELDIPDVLHYFGSINTYNKKIAVHVLKPEYPGNTIKNYLKGTVILLHGYLDHSGAFTKLINELVAHNYVVCCADLPGHGLSEGQRSKIDDFAEYGKLVEYLFKTVKEQLPNPIHIIGHSTGCSAIIEYMLNNQVSPFTSCIMIAPLVHCTNWPLANLGVILLGGFISRLPSISTNTSTNYAYIEFIKKHDPLEVQYVTTSWAKALIRWNKKIKEYKPGLQPITIIQGTMDKTIDYNYNLPVIQKFFPLHEIYFVQGARHTLCCENFQLRTDTFRIIFQTLEQKKEGMFNQRE